MAKLRVQLVLFFIILIVFTEALRVFRPFHSLHHVKSLNTKVVMSRPYSSSYSSLSLSSKALEKVPLSSSDTIKTIWNPESFDYRTSDKLPWSPEGYRSWTFRGHKVNFVDLGGDESKKKQSLLLVHGFGASVYHWRYNLPVLARDYHVYAIDLLGFGLSEKPIINYTSKLWKDQVVSFLKEVVHKESGGRPAVVAGNSIGGYTALYASASPEAIADNLIKGCILVNAACTFKSEESDIEKPDDRPEWLKKMQSSFQRFVIGLSFIFTKQPLRIQQVLRQVYPINPDNVTPDLVESIRYPAQDPNAPEVFYRVILREGEKPPYSEDLLTALKCPLMLLWGTSDPWIRVEAANTIQRFYPSAMRVDVAGGHCPHDEAPEACNEAIKRFMQTLT